MDLRSYNYFGRYFWEYLQRKYNVHSNIDHDIITKNVISEENKELVEQFKMRLNLELSEIENILDFKEKNILTWEIQGTDVVIKRRVTLKDAYIQTIRVTMQGNSDYKKIEHFVISKEDHICNKFGSIADAEDFIKEHKDRLIN